MPNLTIVAHIHADPSQIEHVKSRLKMLIEPTRAEAGCVQYDLHQDNNDPAHFMFFENWESLEHLKAHAKSAHIAAHRAATKDAIVKMEIIEMTLVD